ncbi:hypothetical protein CAPTEDRAFT_205433 [Capitella teleta]|uniref:Uncharacterized protein n=1 Tax=Capitella teleta TaxID=283909 RepID=R7TUZ5_CAPTE|nr:hypothetical protein CAPTEDRAFT_205433 [Capitella teleta]|eukprot:ELT97392.1 hypothetical protein CAPTEDRAFT_205433 [Capitella teleta]
MEKKAFQEQSAQCLTETKLLNERIHTAEVTMAEQQQVIKQSHFSPLAAVSNFVKFVTHEWVSRKLEEGVDPSSLAKQLKGNENLGYSNYQESSLGKQFTGEELEANLLEVLCLNVDEEEAISSDLSYRNEMDIHEAMDHKKASLSSKLVAARRARQAEQAKTLLPALLKDPSSLVGKRVVHHVHNPGEAAEWYSGVVLAISRAPKAVINNRNLMLSMMLMQRMNPLIFHSLVLDHGAVKAADSRAKDAYKQRYDKRYGVKQMTPLDSGQQVRLKLDKEKGWTATRIVQKAQPDTLSLQTTDLFDVIDTS